MYLDRYSDFDLFCLSPKYFLERYPEYKKELSLSEIEEYSEYLLKFAVVVCVEFKAGNLLKKFFDKLYPTLQTTLIDLYGKDLKITRPMPEKFAKELFNIDKIPKHPQKESSYSSMLSGLFKSNTSISEENYYIQILSEILYSAIDLAKRKIDIFKPKGYVVYSERMLNILTLHKNVFETRQMDDFLDNLTARIQYVKTVSGSKHNIIEKIKGFDPRVYRHNLFGQFLSHPKQFLRQFDFPEQDLKIVQEVLTMYLISSSLKTDVPKKYIKPLLLLLSAPRRKIFLDVYGDNLDVNRVNKLLKDSIPDEVGRNLYTAVSEVLSEFDYQKLTIVENLLRCDITSCNSSKFLKSIPDYLLETHKQYIDLGVEMLKTKDVITAIQVAEVIN